MEHQCMESQRLTNLLEQKNTAWLLCLLAKKLHQENAKQIILLIAICNVQCEVDLQQHDLLLDNCIKSVQVPQATSKVAALLAQMTIGKQIG